MYPIIIYWLAKHRSKLNHLTSSKETSLFTLPLSLNSAGCVV